MSVQPVIEAITRDVINRGYRLSHLEVERVNGHIVLKGTSPTYYIKQLAQEAAIKALSGGEFGRVQVLNQIEVNASGVG